MLLFGNIFKYNMAGEGGVIYMDNSAKLYSSHDTF